MPTYKITYVENWITVSSYWKEAESHKKALNDDIHTLRVNNKRFREIERTGAYYMVQEIGKQCHIYERIK
jgi:hypothetical protein